MNNHFLWLSSGMKYIPVSILMLLVVLIFSIETAGCTQRDMQPGTSEMTTVTEIDESETTVQEVGEIVVPVVTEPAEGTDSSTEVSTSALTILESMTLHEKICQMFVVSVSDFDPTVITTIEQSALDRLQEYPVGGFLFMANNLSSREQTTQLIEDLQHGSSVPLFIAADEEGGCVNRIMDTLKTTYFEDMFTYRDEGPETAYSNAKTIAGDMLLLGFNWDFAPVADVWTNPENTVIGPRAYSDDYVQSAELITAAVCGFHDGGIACTLKHFPGHGDTSEDSHDGAAYVYKTIDELRTGEILSFQAGIEEGADAVMVGHITVPEISDMPALFSKEIVTDLLRGELGFDGVVITDSLQMGAITDNYSQAETALLAVQAGVDILLEPTELDVMVAVIDNAVNEGVISEARIDESVFRILTMKERWGLLEATF